MYDDAENRIKDFAEKLPVVSSIAKRISSMIPSIEAARERGAKWEDIASVIGIKRETLISAYFRATRSNDPRRKKVTVSSGEKSLRKGIEPWGKT